MKFIKRKQTFQIGNSNAFKNRCGGLKIKTSIKAGAMGVVETGLRSSGSKSTRQG